MLAFSTIHMAKTMPFSPADNTIMTIGEVADYLKVTERTIYRLAGAKQIPALRWAGAGGFQRPILMLGSRRRRAIGRLTDVPRQVQPS